MTRSTRSRYAIPNLLIGIAILIPPGGSSIRCSTYARIRRWYAGNARA